ncbi:MAG: putative glycoside hydrolase [Faecousia sp.]
MYSIPYRTKLRLKAALKVLGICVAVVIVLVALALIYLQRYVVYSADGPYLDFHRSTAQPVSVETSTGDEPTQVSDVNIIFDNAGGEQDDEAALSGYYIDIAMLQDPQAVYDALQELSPCTVMIDLKSSSGNFYYSTSIAGAPRAEIDVTVVDSIISYLKTRGFNMIARVETFRDTAFALDHFSSGLSIRSGVLWSDKGVYWIDPGDEVVVAYLKQIAKELSSKGFKEIVFDDFYFPDSGQIVYTSEKTKSELIQDTASELQNFFNSSNVTISFGNPAPDFTPEGDGSHLFISDVDGSNVNSVIASYSGLSDAKKQLVFLTASRDTRFEGYSLLRPLLA